MQALIFIGLALASFPPLACAAGRMPLLDAIAQVETGGDHAAIGDHGRARGAWQMHRVGWADVNGVRALTGRRQVRYAAANDPRTARAYAEEYMGIVIRRLSARLGRQPGAQEIYAAWNLGLDGFARRGFSLAKCPPSTQAAAQNVLNLTR